MHDVGFWQHIIQDLSGKGQFRLILQPAMAIFLGIRFGIADAKAGTEPFGVRLFTGDHPHWQVFKESISAAAKPLVFAVLMDGFFQYLTLHRVRLLPALIVGGLLVWIPFGFARGFSNRFWRRQHAEAPLHHHHGQQKLRH
jgi:hypothetical protein